MKKLIVISAPSGSGKTSIVQHLLQEVKELAFSISACSRDKRENELEAKDYYFLSTKEFKQKIHQNAFLEWEEVYSNQYYGTLKSEIQRIWGLDKHVIFDIDVEGGMKIKKYYGEACLAIFIMPPSIKILKERLIKRGTESKKSRKLRVEKSEKELKRHKEFDKVILNDDFNTACQDAFDVITKFIKY